MTMPEELASIAADGFHGNAVPHDTALWQETRDIWLAGYCAAQSAVRDSAMFDAGWIVAASWTGGHLIADMDSEAFKRDKAKAMAAVFNSARAEVSTGTVDK